MQDLGIKMSDRIFTKKIQIRVIEYLINGTKIIKYFNIDPDFFETTNPTEENPWLELNGKVKNKGEFKE